VSWPENKYIVVRREHQRGHTDEPADGDQPTDLAPPRRTALAGGHVQVLYRPDLDGNIRDVVGLRLHPPERVVVL
jgi:hypothetical protein